MNQREKTILERIARESEHQVWWSPSQRARGDDIVNDPTQGERPWIIPESTGQFLHDLIIQAGSQNILELGTSVAYSTLWMAFALPEKGHLTTIERSVNKIAVAKENIQDSETSEKITLCEGEILSTLSELPQDVFFDFVFLDADRGHYHEYFPLIKNHLTSDAFIVADNAGNMNDRMRLFLDLLDKEGWDYEIKDFDNGILIAKQQSKKTA